MGGAGARRQRQAGAVRDLEQGAQAIRARAGHANALTDEEISATHLGGDHLIAIDPDDRVGAGNLVALCDRHVLVDEATEPVSP